MSSTASAASKVQLPLGFLALVSLVNFLAALQFAKDDTVAPSTFFVLLGLAIGTGLIVALGALEEVFGSSVADFKTARWALTALLAVFAYAGRAQAISDVNAIFHVDAGALPMTVLAGTVMYSATLLFWVFIAISGTSALVVWAMYAGNVFDEHAEDIQKIRGYVVALAVLISCGLSALFVRTHLDDESRAQKLYRIAHMTDFSGSFRCIGVDYKANDVLFIGPEQRHILVAPKIFPVINFGPAAVTPPDLLQRVQIPAEFEEKECVAPSKLSSTE